MKLDSGLWRVFLVATLLLGMMGTVSAQTYGFYHLNESSSPAKDYSGAGYNGSWNGGLTSGVSGAPNTSSNDLAYNFDGSDDWVNFGTNTYSDLIENENQGEWMLTGWIKVDELPHNDGDIYKFHQLYSDSGMFLCSTGSSSSFSIQSSGDNAGNCPQYDNQTISMNKNEWYHYAGGYKENGYYIMYVNGEKLFNISTSDNFTSGDPGTNPYATLGKMGGSDTSSSANWFNGTADEQRFHDNILSSSEVKNLYNCNQLQCNTAPSIDSVSTSPSSWTLGSSINVSADVSGYVSSVDGVWKYENGTQFDSFNLSDGDGNGVWEADNTGPIDVFDENVTMELTAINKNTGETSNYTEEQFIKDSSSGVNVPKPKNKTYLEYSPPYEVYLNDDGDDVPNEKSECEIRYEDSLGSYGVQDTVNLTEGGSTTGTLSHNKGSFKFNATCTELEGEGNTESMEKYYSVAYSKVLGYSGPRNIFETYDPSFDINVKFGDMVENVTYNLNWNGSQADQVGKIDVYDGTTTTVARTLTKTDVPLVQSNNTLVNWSFNYVMERETAPGEPTKTCVNCDKSSYTKIYLPKRNQSIYWSYWLESADTIPANGKYIETENLKHKVEIGTETKKAELSGNTQYSRNSETDKMTVTENTSSSTIFKGNIDVGQADNFNKSTFQTSSDIQIKFNGQTRTLSTAQDNVEVYRIQLFDQANPGSLTTSKALKFDTQYEETGAEVNTRLTMDLSVWKNRNELIRRFNFNKNPASSHSFYIYPAWASYKIRTLPYPDQTKFDLIQYWNDNKNYVRRSYFFPTTQTISNQTTTVPLRTINRSETTKIDFEILNSGGSSAQNVYCRVDRKFGGGSFSTVFMIKTGSQGRGQSFAETNEIYYSFTCYKNGKVIETFPSQIMQNPMVLKLGQQQVETVLDYQNTFDAACTYNETQISCDYQSQSEKMSKAKLTVERLEPVQNVQVCSKTSSSITGKLACNQINTTKNDYRYIVEGVYPGGTITGAAGQTGVNNSGMGAGGLILTIFIFMFVFAATSFNVPLGIAAGTFTLLLTETVGLWVLTPTMRASLIAVALIAGLVTRR